MAFVYRSDRKIELSGKENVSYNGARSLFRT